MLTAYCPLGSGKEKGGDVPDVLGNETIVKIAGIHSCTPAQIVLAWAIGKGMATIPKSTNEARQRENLSAAGIKLSADEIAGIDALDQGYRYIDGTVWMGNGSPYSLGWLWEGGEIS